MERRANAGGFIGIDADCGLKNTTSCELETRSQASSRQKTSLDPPDCHALILRRFVQNLIGDTILAKANHLCAKMNENDFAATAPTRIIQWTLGPRRDNH
ncbi:MAG: hypothetical protein WBO09_18835 [Methylocystis silviterrae]|uniref:hypothetical protein n=1 Tax=Methylocystis silviterrae TaxID=2743612 RepID=UPI003C712B0C